MILVRRDNMSAKTLMTGYYLQSDVLRAKLEKAARAQTEQLVLEAMAKGLSLRKPSHHSKS